MADEIVKKTVGVISRCLSSTNKDVALAGLNNLLSASATYGPQLNAHLGELLPLIHKKVILFRKKAKEVMEVLIQNGGKEVEAFIQEHHAEMLNCA